MRALPLMLDSFFLRIQWCERCLRTVEAQRRLESVNVPSHVSERSFIKAFAYGFVKLTISFMVFNQVLYRVLFRISFRVSFTVYFL